MIIEFSIREVCYVIWVIAVTIYLFILHHHQNYLSKYIDEEIKKARNRITELDQEKDREINKLHNIIAELRSNGK